MAEVPSVKGVGFQDVWEQVNALIEEGRLSREEVELRLEAEGTALLESKPEPSLWYPVTATDRFMRLLADVEGDGDPEHARDLGRQALGAILARDALRGFIDAAIQRGDRAGHALIGLSRLVYSFGEWRYRGDDLRHFEVEVRDAAALPELGALATAGFVEALAAEYAGEPVRVSLTRPSPDRVVFRGEPA